MPSVAEEPGPPALFAGLQSRLLSPRPSAQWPRAPEAGDFASTAEFDCTAPAVLVQVSSRLQNRVQLSSDAMGAYVDAAEVAFGTDVDYAQIVKSYEAEPAGAGRYSPPHVTSAHRTPIMGNPDFCHVSTSFIERENLTIRMGMRRFTRLTNGFYKKVENLRSALAVHFAYYNFVRVHQTLRATPAMTAGVTPRLWTIGDLLDRTL